MSAARAATSGALLVGALVALTPHLSAQAAARRGPAWRPTATASSAPAMPALNVVEVRKPDAPYPVAEPASLRVLFVEIPREIQAVGGTFYHAERGPWQTLGPRAGWLEPNDSVPLAYTLVVPGMAAAGENTIGLVRFVTHGDKRIFDVPLMVDVAGRPDISVGSARALVGGRPGARVRTEWEVHNRGNVAVDLYLHVQTAGGWTPRLPNDGRLRVPRGSSVVVPVDILVPADASYGDYAVTAAVRDEHGNGVSASSGVRISRAEAGVADGSSQSASHGELAVGSARDDRGAAIHAVDARVQLAVPFGLLATARYGEVGNRATGISANTVGRLGFANRTRQLRLNARTWEASFGNVGRSGDGVSAVSLFGEGGVGAWETETLRGGAVAVRPIGGEGQYLLFEGQRRIGTAWTGFMLADLSDNLVGERFARTVAADLDLPVPGGALRLQAGHRSTSFGSGPTWQLEVDQRRPEWGASFSTSHNPGGSSALAAAENSHQVDAHRRLNAALSVGASAWTSSDETNAARKFGARGVSTQLSWRVGPSATLAGDVRSTRWESRGALGSVETGEHSLNLSGSATVGRLLARAGVRAGEVMRGSSLLALGTSRSTAGQAGVTGGLTLALQTATLSADVSHDRTGADVGLPARQTTIELRAERVPVLGGRVLLHAEAGAFAFGVSGSIMDAQSIGAEVRVLRDLALRVEASRSALFRQHATAPSPWVIGVRLQRAVALPAWSGERTLGRLYVDANGNGVRDRGERAVAGALVAVDGDLVPTDDRGRYRGARPASVRVDPRSLPLGHLVAPSARNGAPGDIAIVPTAPIVVRVEVVNPERTPIGEIDPRRFIVSLRDARGRAWSGATDSTGSTRFDALPLGTYRIEVDASAQGEPLTAGGATYVTVSDEIEARVVTISVSPRRVRPITAPAAGIRRSTGGSEPPARLRPP